MKIFGWYITRRDPNATSRVVTPRGVKAGYDQMALDAYSLRRGMWVMKAGFPRAGILTGVNAEGIARVMLTTEIGTDLAETDVLASSLRQARQDEIPAKRRETDVAKLEAMGYMRASK